MNNPILRTLIWATLFSLMSGIVVLVIGLTLGWKTSTQFSDGFFWAGGSMLSLGLLSVLGGYSEPTTAGAQYRQSVVHFSPAERSRRWAEDTVRNYRIQTFLGLSGLLLLGLAGLAIVVGNLF